MDSSQAAKNQRKWETFLSTIRTEKKETKPQIKKTEQKTERKGGIQCLAYDFAHKLLDNSNSTVTITGPSQYISMVKNRTDLHERLVPISKSKSFPVDQKTEKSKQFSGTTVCDKNGRLDKRQQEVKSVIKKGGSINITGEKRGSQSKPSECAYGASKPAKCYKPSMGNYHVSNQIFHKPEFKIQQLDKVDSYRYDVTQSDVDIDESKILDSEIETVVLRDETDVRAEPKKTSGFKTDTCVMDENKFADQTKNVYMDVELTKGDKSKLDEASTYKDLSVIERKFEAAEKAPNINMVTRKDDVNYPNFITEDERKIDKNGALSSNSFTDENDTSERKGAGNLLLIKEEMPQDEFAEGRLKDIIMEEEERDEVTEFMPPLASKISEGSRKSIGQRDHVALIQNQTDLSKTSAPVISKSRSVPVNWKKERDILFPETSRIDSDTSLHRLNEVPHEETPVIQTKESIDIVGGDRNWQSKYSEGAASASKSTKWYKPSIGNDQISNQIFHKLEFKDQQLIKVHSDRYDVTQSDVDNDESELLHAETEPVVQTKKGYVRTEPQKTPEFKVETCKMDRSKTFAHKANEDTMSVESLKGDRSENDETSTYENLLVNKRRFEVAEKDPNVNMVTSKDEVFDRSDRKNDKKGAKSTNFDRKKIDISKRKVVGNLSLFEKEILQDETVEGQAKDMIKEESEQDEVIEVIPHLTSKISAESVASIECDIDLQRQRERNKPSRKKVKKDIDNPCSKWTMVSFAKYFDFDSTVSLLTIPVCPSSLEGISIVQKQITKEVKKRCKVMFDTTSPDMVKDFFKGMRSNEITVRILVDAIFLTLCSSLGYRVEVGKEIKNTILIPCEFDYRILHKGRVIGSIEAKSTEGLKKVSVIQAVLQLTVLQAEIIESGMTNIPPLFNIVTDGVRYIFIQLKGKKLQFEQKFGKLHINRVESIEDLEDLVPKLVNLVRMSEDSSNEETCESDGDDVLDLT